MTGPSAPPVRRKRRRSDWTVPLASFLAIACVVGFGYETYSNTKDIRAGNHRRVEDLRTSCRQASARAAAQATLDWVYYESEVQLTWRPHLPPSVLRGLDAGDLKILAFFTGGATPGLQIIQARAIADYNAAFLQAQTVDYRDVAEIPAKTKALGSNAPVQRWVLHRHFSCHDAFRG